jgi:transposase-like protein
MGKRKNFSSAQKFSAAIEIIKGEKSGVTVGRELNCHPTLIADWRDKVLEKGSMVFDQANADIVKDKRIADLERMVGKLVSENGFLERVLGRSSGA